MHHGITLYREKRSSTGWQTLNDVLHFGEQRTPTA